jgi:hypothetical protein
VLEAGRLSCDAPFFDGRAWLICSSAKNKLVLPVREPHAPSVAKTWVSKNVINKSEKAFVKAMRLLTVPKGRRNYTRPR